MHRVALILDPAPALLEPLVRGLAAAGYHVAFSAPSGAGRGLVRDLGRGRRRILPLQRSLDADLLVRAVQEELGRLDLVIVEPERAETAPSLVSAETGSEVGTVGPAALGAARAALELLGESGGSVVRLLRPQGGDAGGAVGSADVTSTRRLGLSLAALVRVNGVSIPLEPSDGVGTDRTPASVVRAVLWLAGSQHLNGEVVSIDPGRGGPRGARGEFRRQ